MSFEVLSSGHRLAEGPRVGADGSVWFTDVLGGGVHRWSDGAVEVVVPKRRGVGGLALHADGGVVVTGRDLVHVTPDGTNRVLLPLPDGVTGFNDCCALADGSVLVGALRWLPFAPAGDEVARVPGEFWRVPAGGGGAATVAFDGIVWANGCGVDVGRDRVYANDYASGTVWVSEGGAAPRRFADVPGAEADGLAVDDEGGVWVAVPGARRVVRLSPDDGAEIGGLDVDGDDAVTSVAFDGAGGMVVTTGTAVLRCEAPVPGPRHLLATL